MALLWVSFAPTPTHAQGNARWGGDSILFENHGYALAQNGSYNDTSNTIPADATVYKTPVQTIGTGTDATQKVFVIYFSSGVDPPTATEAQYVEFDYKNGSLSNPHNQQTISLTVKAEQDGYSSCAVEGVGWIICPISVFLADAMDTIFDLLSGMIETQPLILGDTSNSLYIAWSVMRSVANVAFVIAFLIIIYSQLTGMGFSNYIVKKMIPRLVVAAILVNLSFLISAFAIDVSNILGYSVQDVFQSLRNSTFALTNDNVDGFVESPWSSVTAAVLAGGGVVGGVYYLASGGLYMLMPLLLGLILTIVLVVVILAARQAIIIILVIISPLAFVANLLPNTEKWFDKWKDIFLTMLIFFPAFSFVFGASQLAGQIIIQNAGDNIITLLFGLAVQIAPLIITPLILKLSGNLLGKIANIVNDPRKGLIDRNRTAMQQRAEIHRNRNIHSNPRGWQLANPTRWGAGMVRRTDFKKRSLKEKSELWSQAAANRYEESPQYSGIKKNGQHTRRPGLHERRAAVDLRKESIHNNNASHIEHLKRTPGNDVFDAAMGVEVSKETLEGHQQATTAFYNYQRSDATTALGAATRIAQGRKLHAEAAQNHVKAILDTEQATVGTPLHLAHIQAQEAKLRAQASAQSLTHINERYQTGKQDVGGNEQLTELMNAMVESTYRHSAESIGIAAAQDIQKKGFANALRETDESNAPTSTAQELITIASSVDAVNGATRAHAAAISQIARSEKEALENSTIFLKSEAEDNNKNILEWSRDIFKRHIGTYENEDGITLPAEPQNPAILEAAMNILADDGDINVMREALMNPAFDDQAMMSRVVARNETTLKIKGGFDIQQKMGALWNVSQEEMDISIAGSLGAVSADKIAGQKWGWWNSLAPTNKPDDQTAIKRIITNVQNMPEGKDKTHAQNMLRSFYSNLTTALTSPEIMTQIGDRNVQTGKMHRILQSTPGLILHPVAIDYELIARGLASTEENKAAKVREQNNPNG